MRKLLLFFGLLFLAACKNTSQDPIEGRSELRAVIPELRYGIVVNDRRVEEAEVKNGENLSIILNRYGASGTLVHRAIQAAKGIFDARSIRAGQKYTVISDNDSLPLLYWIYEKDQVTYYVFDFTDSLPQVSRHDRPVETHLRSLGGVINSSLFKTVLDAGAGQELAVRLAGVFDWTVDFFSIQKGDYFRVVYEEKTVEGKPYGMGKILAAEFNHRHKAHYAILWDHNGKPDQYYNENGESMRKRYLKAPLEYSRISSKFSANRLHPVLKTNRPHLGVDYAAPTGTPIRSIGDGTVVEAGFKGGNGNYVKVKHNQRHATGYLHMSKIAPGIKPGVRVSQGQVIGYVGSTGLATGPHLCFRFWENGVQVNPLRIQTPPADPMPDKNKPIYFVHRDSMMLKLNAVQMPAIEG
jgi:murein DD-endopeptidase MepM/ murein hydrolase activator NlpD